MHLGLPHCIVGWLSGWLCLVLRGHLVSWSRCINLPHWVRLLDRVLSPSGYLLSPIRHVWEVILQPGSRKFSISIPIDGFAIAGESLLVLVHSAEKYVLIMAEVPSDGAGLQGTSEICSFCFSFCIAQYSFYSKTLVLKNTFIGLEKYIMICN